jgi:hypothetical protein
MRKTAHSSRRSRSRAALPETSALALTMAVMLQATPVYAQETLQMAEQGTAQDTIELPAVEVTADSQTSQSMEGTTVSAGTGTPADMNDAASAFIATGEDVNGPMAEALSTRARCSAVGSYSAGISRSVSLN